MPCIFLNNVPQRRGFNGELVRRLRDQIAQAASCTPEGVEIHLSFNSYVILSDSGSVKPCKNIHGFVLWFGKEERDDNVKRSIANALQHFLNEHGLGKGLDITFMDMPAGSFFIEQDGVSVMVAGGELLPPFNQIAYVVGEHTGFGREE